MKIISVLGSKGGSGKSTVSLILAASFSKQGKTALLDCDIQSTCLSAKKVNPQLPYEVFSTPHIEEIVLKGRQLESSQVEWVVIDTNPRSFLEDPNQIDTIIQLSDICLLPCRPAPRDIRANLELSKQLTQKTSNAHIVWNFVQNRVNAHKASMKQASAFLGLHSLKSFLKQRICYQDVFDEPPLPLWNINAKKEVESLVKEVRRKVNG